ncbi:HTH domain-containing protein, partial [Streptomyces griseus]|nr:HTH domain-containing protein [Streptomyces griseus]
TRAGDQVPRDQVLALTAELLDADPTISAATVTERLGVHRDTAQQALTRLRADRVADHIAANPTLTPAEAAAQ